MLCCMNTQLHLLHPPSFANPQLGDMVDFQSSYDRYRPLLPDAPPLDSTWKTTPGQGNDVIYNLGSHIIDQAYVLFGMPEKLSCRCWDVRDIGLDEAVSLVLILILLASTTDNPVPLGAILPLS